MKTAFICNNKNNLQTVFGQDIITALDLKAYNKDDVINSPALFCDTEYIFSSWGMPFFSEQEIKEYLPSLKAVFYAAGTVQSFAHPFLNSGVKVFSAFAANAVPVAEYTVAQIVLANKGFYQSSALASRGERDIAAALSNNYCGNYGAKVGIIGAGMIGRLVIDMLKSYRLDVFVFDPFLPDEKAEQLQVKKVSLEELFASCNVISNHLANNPQTVGMLNGTLFERMLPYSTFINTGRGAQVVEADLVNILKQRPDVTAILDVTYPEPPAKDSEFYSLSNCILTPHIAGSSGNEVGRLAEYMYNEYKAFVADKPTKYEVTLKMLETMA